MRVLLLILAVPGVLLAQQASLEGRLVDEGGEPLAGIEIVVQETGERTVSDRSGAFSFSLPHGSYTLLLVAGDARQTLEPVAVDPPESTRVEHTFSAPMPVALRPTVSVFGRSERWLEAPAAVLVPSASRLDAVAADGRPPKTAEFGLGADVVQTGDHTFEVGARAWTEAMNPRLATRIDGRDPARLFWGGVDWPLQTRPLDDLETVELLRGGASDRYGSGGLQGGLDLVTRTPDGGGDGTVRAGGGEPSAVIADLRWSERLAGNTWFKLLGSGRESEGFAVSRTTEVEYSRPCSSLGEADCLPLEAIPLDPAGDESVYTGSLRLDHQLRAGARLAVEGGWGSVEGPVVPSDLGRLQTADAEAAWGRIDFSSFHWTLRAQYEDRDTDRLLALQTGDRLTLEEQRYRGEVETRWQFGAFGLQAGLSHTDDDLSSLDPQGPRRPTRLRRGNQETLLLEPISEDANSAWSQLRWDGGDRVSLLAGVRYDDGPGYDSQLSPRAALVFELARGQTVRLGYARGFRAATYAELSLFADLASPLNLAPLEAICFREGLDCGFDLDFDPDEDLSRDPTPDTRQVLFGNRELEPERVDSWEIGYRGALGSRASLSITGYLSDHDDFVVGPWAPVGSDLGRLNPTLAPYTPPEQLSEAASQQLLAALEDALGPLFPFLGLIDDRSPVVALLTYGNRGSAESRGVEVGLDWRLGRAWQAAAAWSWLDVELDRASPDLERVLVPNAPEHRLSLGLGWSGRRLDARVDLRWLDDFRWVSLPFQGDVDSFLTADLAANLHLSRVLTLGITVTNVADEEHWQTFGADLLGRRALGHLAVHW